MSIDFGMGEKNPVDHMLFYSKKNPDQLFQLKKEHVGELLFSDLRMHSDVRLSSSISASLLN